MHGHTLVVGRSVAAEVATTGIARSDGRSVETYKRSELACALGRLVK